MIKEYFLKLLSLLGLVFCMFIFSASSITGWEKTNGCKAPDPTKGWITWKHYPFYKKCPSPGNSSHSMKGYHLTYEKR
ncbi:MAG: hypothetical protein GOU97_05030 [Nanoarchaeota archaeon]|nr:hypothetical protein [Nanoarchaeota archaeon]